MSKHLSFFSFFLSLLFLYSPSPSPFSTPTRVENADVSGKERVCVKSSLFLRLFISFQKTASLNFLYPHLQLVELRNLFFVLITSLMIFFLNNRLKHMHNSSLFGSNKCTSIILVIYFSPVPLEMIAEIHSFRSFQFSSSVSLFSFFFLLCF